MTEKDFATMSIEELKAYCESLQKELSKAQWYLRNRLMGKAEKVSAQNDRKTPVL